jgi:hypothetical protein
MLSGDLLTPALLPKASRHIHPGRREVEDILEALVQLAELLGERGSSAHTLGDHVLQSHSGPLALTSQAFGESKAVGHPLQRRRKALGHASRPP